jgi:hypothetical protein
MIPIGDAFDPSQDARQGAGGQLDDMPGSGGAASAPARQLCRPLLTARRGGPGRR